MTVFDYFLKSKTYDDYKLCYSKLIELCDNKNFSIELINSFDKCLNFIPKKDRGLFIASNIKLFEILTETRNITLSNMHISGGLIDSECIEQIIKILDGSYSNENIKKYLTIINIIHCLNNGDTEPISRGNI